MVFQEALKRITNQEGQLVQKASTHTYSRPISFLTTLIFGLLMANGIHHTMYDIWWNGVYFGESANRSYCSVKTKLVWLKSPSLGVFI